MDIDIIIYQMSINTGRLSFSFSYVWSPLGPYISLVNNSIYLIMIALGNIECIRTHIWNLSFIGYPSCIIFDARLINDLGYDQQSNPNWSLKLVLMYGGNHQE